MSMSCIMHRSETMLLHIGSKAVWKHTECDDRSWVPGVVPFALEVKSGGAVAAGEDRRIARLRSTMRPERSAAGNQCHVVRGGVCMGRGGGGGHGEEAGYYSKRRRAGEGMGVG